TGSSPDQAIERAWAFLGMYGTRGASFSVLAPLANRENLPVFLSFYLISSMMGVLDQRTFATGHAYSYPKSIESRCGFARPYHFWLAAYLSRFLRKKGYSFRS